MFYVHSQGVLYMPKHYVFFRKSDYYDNVYVKYDYLQDYFNSGFVLGGATALVLNYLQKPTTPLITNN